jgi:glycosyltransferase involved in cell wall biosynthesis
VGVLASRLARTPVTIVTRHHLDQVRLIGTKFHVYLDGWMARQSDRVVVLSHAVRNYMIESDRVDRNKIEVIYQGFDFQGFSANEADRQRVREELGIESRFVLGCIGNLHKTKGHIYLFQALKQLAKEIPNVCVLLLGDGDRDLIKTMVRELELEDRVIFAGFRRDVPACISAMDIVVHPSLSEAFCQVLIEAMSVGTPLVATNVGGAAEVVAHGETGVLIPPADPAAISQAVLELYRNPEQRRRMAQAGQSSVRSRFTIERMVNQQVDCYQRWLGEADAKRSVKLEAKYKA